MPWNEATTSFPDDMKLLFVGRLDWYPNVEGLNWFLDKVWPVISHKRPELTLDIVGGFGSETLIEKIKVQKNIRYHGRVPDVSAFYQQCTITIIPIWTGSGTRVKAIEAAKFARSFITTTKGIEGVELTAGRDYLLADDEQSWIESLLNLASHNAKQLGQSAQENAGIKYDQEFLRKRFLELLERLT
jgi:glycosyltransferase involved in cell wall biosynthesis